MEEGLGAKNRLIEKVVFKRDFENFVEKFQEDNKMLGQNDITEEF